MLYQNLPVETNVDRCFQCSEFPCDKLVFGSIRERWIRINDRMKDQPGRLLPETA